MSNSDRRTFLRYSSIIPVAMASAGTGLKAEAAAVQCDNVKEHAPVDEQDPILAEARDALWAQFIAGTGAANPNAPPVPEATEEHIVREQGKKLRRKMKFWLVCEDETKMCAFLAGAIAELLREAGGDAGITVPQFEKAKRVVQKVQQRRLGRANIGIVC